MLRRIVLVLVTMVALCAVVSQYLLAQSKEEGIKVFDEAKALQERAQTNRDLQLAVQKYQQALAIFQRLGFKYGIGYTAEHLGLIFSH